MSTVISAEDQGLKIREVRAFGSLLRYLSLRDVYVRYKQTWMGLGWSVIRPLLNMLIFGSFSYLIDSSGSFADRFIVVSGAVVFWQLISTTMTEVSISLLANANILTKVYFPKVILPLSGLLVCLVDFVIAFIIFMIIYVALKGVPGPQVFVLPFVVLYALCFAFSIGLLTATASVRYRDVKFILPFLIQILFYVSPVIISSGFVASYGLPRWLLTIYQLNPLVLMINLFKWCVFGTLDHTAPVPALLSVIFVIILVFASLRYFSRFERSFADYI